MFKSRWACFSLPWSLLVLACDIVSFGHMLLDVGIGVSLGFVRETSGSFL